MSEAMSPTNEAMSPTTPDGPTSPTRTAPSVSRVAPMPAAVPRPGLVTFAAVMLFVAAGFSLLSAIEQISAASWIKANLSSYGYGNMASYLWAWAILDLILAAVAIYAGVDILRGGVAGLLIGLTIAVVSAIRWFFYLPAVPWVATVVIALDVLIIYGLVANSEYFGRLKMR